MRVLKLIIFYSNNCKSNCWQKIPIMQTYKNMTERFSQKCKKKTDKSVFFIKMETIIYSFLNEK